MLRAIAFAGALVAAMPALAGPIDKLTFYTETYPPYNMAVEGEIRGLAGDLTRVLLREHADELTMADVKLVPWARGYRTAIKEPNTVLFSTARTAERENLFRWAGPIAPNRLAIIGQAAAPAVESLADLRGHKTATIRSDVSELHLLNQGLPEAALLRLGAIDTIPDLLERGRITYWAYGAEVAMYELARAGLAADYEVKMVLAERNLYYAINPASDPEAVTALRQAVREIRETPRYAEIRDRYLE